jgi:hypothetical protein
MCGSDEFGKRVFPDRFDVAPDATLYVTRICPAIHYTMGTHRR